MDTIYSFGEWIKRQRKLSGLTQRELAERAYCSVVTIKKIEADQRRPSRELAGFLARSLAVPDDQLEIFIECARGQRPVDHLRREHETGHAEVRTVRMLSIKTPPLPVAQTRLIGRETELDLLHRLLSESWLVTIVGIGGIGKTRLALAAATQQQRAGQTTTFISLAGLKAGDNLAATIVPALGLQLATGTDPITQLLSYLQQKTMLLVLDNFEHLLESAHLLTQMHQAAPELILLVTSRASLHLPGEQLLPLQGLRYPHDQREMPDMAEAGEMTQYSAVQLFLDHARRLIPNYSPNNDVALLQLCRITNGLPLALELAASWINSLTLPDLVQELKISLDLLTQKQSNLPARHHSMRAVLDTTWLF